VLLDVSVFTGAATVIGPLGTDFTTAGATWSDAMNVGDGGLYGLNGATSQLYEIDPNTGVATPTVTVTGVTIGSVGIELHPFDGELYICTTDAVLYRGFGWRLASGGSGQSEGTTATSSTSNKSTRAESTPSNRVRPRSSETLDCSVPSTRITTDTR
jgi:hypothetical protein